MDLVVQSGAQCQNYESVPYTIMGAIVKVLKDKEKKKKIDFQHEPCSQSELSLL